jgi:hypothetical protein
MPEEIIQKNRSNGDTDLQWFKSRWFRFGFGLFVCLMIFVAFLTGVKSEYIVAQLMFHLCVYWSLSILSDRPLINPIQTFIFLFYWWFGAAPIVMGAFDMFSGNLVRAVYDQESGMEGLWIVAAGLPLYALVAKRTLKRMELKQKYFKFLMPQSFQYHPETLLIYFSIGTIAMLAIEVLKFVGIQGIQSINYLGGTRTDIWWVGVLRAIGDVMRFATVAVMVSLAVEFKKAPKWLVGLGAIIIVQTLVTALTSGSKSAFVVLFFYALCARVSLKQKPPWLIIGAVLFVYLFFIEPMVSTTRGLAQVYNSATSKDREEVFSQVLKQNSLTSFQKDREVQVGSIFRGIYPVAGSITRSNTWFDGYWNGLTIGWGLLVNVPRAFAPNKPDADIGNFFARTVGVTTGITVEDNYDLNISVSIPFEFVGNFGWMAGIITFPFIGFAWAKICGLLLSPQRLSDHPLAPFFVYLTITFESAFGNVLAEFRDLIFPLAVMFVVWKFYRTRL